MVTCTTGRPAAQMLILGPTLGSPPNATPHAWAAIPGLRFCPQSRPSPSHPHQFPPGKLSAPHLLSLTPSGPSNPFPAAGVGFQKVQLIRPPSAFTHLLLTHLSKAYCVPGTMLCWEDPAFVLCHSHSEGRDIQPANALGRVWWWQMLSGKIKQRKTMESSGRGVRRCFPE